MKPSPRLFVKDGLIGLGAFVQEAVACGELLVDWTNHPLFSNPPRIPEDWNFIQISPGVLSGPQDPKGNPDAFINHSCEPNAEVRFEDGVRLFAIKNLTAGEEVTFDYAKLYLQPWSMKCRCGELRCRGTIRGIRSPGSRSTRKPPEEDHQGS